MDLKNSILVTGSHRSGTTWVGRVLELDRNLRYVQEPFNRETNPDLAGYRLGNMYAHAQDEDPVRLRQCYLDFLAKTPDDRLMIKDPISVFSAPWMQDEFGLKVLCMVRHPAGFVSSLIKWQWEFHFGYFTAQPKLMEKFTPEIRAKVEHYAVERQEPIYQACLLWNVIYGWVKQIDTKKRKWLVVRYEDLAQQPERQFRKVFRKLDLRWSPEVKSLIREMSGTDKPKESDDPGFKARDSKAMREVWKRRLDSQQIELIKKETSPTWEYFYKNRDWKIH